MHTLVEQNQIDLRYQHFRIHDEKHEQYLLSSIEKHGILMPLYTIPVADNHQQMILLDGFKRFHCACKLAIHQIPVVHIASTDVEGLLRIIRHNQTGALSSFEQACFIEELHTRYTLSLSEIARRVDRSVAWVSVRVDMLRSMSESVRKKILNGEFPLRSYMYTLAPFTRVKGQKKNVDKFVHALSAQRYSTRDIALLAKCFFSGDQTIRDQILEGNSDWTLSMLKNNGRADQQQCTSDEYLYRKITTCNWHTSNLIRLLHTRFHLLSEKKIEKALQLLKGSCKRLLTINREQREYDKSR